MKHIQFGFATLIRCHVSKQVLTIAISHSFTLKRVKILITPFWKGRCRKNDIRYSLKYWQNETSLAMNFCHHHQFFPFPKICLWTLFEKAWISVIPAEKIYIPHYKHEKLKKESYLPFYCRIPWIPDLASGNIICSRAAKSGKFCGTLFQNLSATETFIFAYINSSSRSYLFKE